MCLDIPEIKSAENRQFYPVKTRKKKDFLPVKLMRGLSEQQAWSFRKTFLKLKIVVTVKNRLNDYMQFIVF